MESVRKVHAWEVVASRRRLLLCGVRHLGLKYMYLPG